MRRRGKRRSFFDLSSVIEVSSSEDEDPQAVESTT
jgi:hypothetical protein